MNDEKKTITILKNIKHQTTSTFDADIFLRDPEALKQHITSVAAVDAKVETYSPEKPATRVTSLDSFLTKAPQSSLSFKKNEAVMLESEGNVKTFTHQRENKSRKK